MSISLFKLTKYVIFLLEAFLFVFVHVCRIIISKIYSIYKRGLFFLLFWRQIAWSSGSKKNKLQQHCEWWGADLWPGGIRRGLQQHWQPQHQKCWHERQLSCPAPSSEYTHYWALLFPPPKKKYLEKMYLKFFNGVDQTFSDIIRDLYYLFFLHIFKIYIINHSQYFFVPIKGHWIWPWPEYCIFYES